MTVSAERFINFIKQAKQDNPGEMSDVSGEQNPEPHAIKYPEDDSMNGNRPGQESLTGGAESEAREGKTDYLREAFENFDSGAKETGDVLNEALDSFGDESNVLSKPQTEVAGEKYSSAIGEAFLDELSRIKEAGGLVGKMLTHNITPGSGPIHKRLVKGFKGLGQLVKSQVKRHGAKGAID